MIAFDTNVLLRLYVNDDAMQHAAVKRLVARAEREGRQIWLSNPVLCELVWALQKFYRLDRATCAEVMESIVETALFQMESSAAVRRAVLRYKAGQGDFADYLIHELAAHQGVATLYTFDKALLKEAGFTKP